MRAFLVPKDCFHAIFDHFWQNQFSNFSVIFLLKNVDFYGILMHFWSFFFNFFFVQICLKIIKNTFWRLLEVPKNIFMHCWTIYIEQSKILNFSVYFWSKISKIRHFSCFFKIFPTFFFQNAVFVPKLMKNQQKLFFSSFWDPKHYLYTILGHIGQS